MRSAAIAPTILGALFVLLMCPAAVHAQATRTWVSGVGDDANPCSRVAPCKTFAGVISKTAARGEISVLDPGGFGAVTITKSISIVADGSEGAITAASTSGIIINAGANDVVNIQGLIIEGVGTGLRGIRFLAGKALHVRKTVIRGFQAGPAFGIEIVPGAGEADVFVSDTVVADNGAGATGGGILVAPTGTARAQVHLNRVQVLNNVVGISAAARGAVFISDSVVTGNGTGLAPNGGAIRSFGNNVLVGNDANGLPTETLPLR